VIRLVRDDRLKLPDGTTYAVAKPVNDVLGLRADERYLIWLDAEWGELAPTSEQVARMLGRRRKTEPDSHLAVDLGRIAEVAGGGTEEFGDAAHTIDYVRLAPLLAQVKSLGYARSIEVPSLAALAAWALVQEVEHGSHVLRQCSSCQRPFFARVPAGMTRLAAATVLEWYCQRPAPGLTISCAQVHAVDRFGREREEWSREYRKVMARKLRGTVSEKEFRAWKAVSGPGERGKDWIPFDQWKGRK
jgi:Family of unknown function (DUF6076)